MSFNRFYRIMRYLLVALSIIIFPKKVQASESNYVVNKYSLPKDFNNSELFDMTRDADGFNYLATIALEFAANYAAVSSKLIGDVRWFVSLRNQNHNVLPFTRSYSFVCCHVSSLVI
jgi:hypothetical protein